MTEINTNLQSGQARSNADRANRVTNAQANSIQGLASGLNTRQTIDTIIRIASRRLEPVQQRRAETQVELDSFNLVKTSLESLQETSQTLAERAIWEGKLISSSNESVVTATATTGAKPGKFTLIVDRLALNHQIASQGYEKPEDTVGTGTFKINVGEESSVSIVIDQSNSSLEGLKNAINSASDKVSATIIKTGEKDRPYQMVLTSQTTGSAGRITLEIEMDGGEAPNFENSVDEPSEWKGVGPKAAAVTIATGAGASTTIVRGVGENSAEDDHTFTFTAIQTGLIGGENSLQMRWEDETGRSGVLELDSFNYAPGEPVEFADGLSLIFSQGEVIVGDKFTLRTRAEKSSLFWWLSESDRAAGFAQPSPWLRQGTFGGPIIEGVYDGEEDQGFTLTVQGSGQIGASSNLSIRWESETGQSGVLRVGRGYQSGSKLALIDGLTLTLQPGVLTEGSTSDFQVIAPEISSKWWLDDQEREIPSEILDVTNFVEVEREEDEEVRFVSQPEFPEDIGPRKSSSEREVIGQFEGDEAKIYTFTATRDGTVGTTKDLVLRWEDDRGGSGTLTVGDGYLIGRPLPFDSGLSISFGPGRIFNEDSFTLRTRTSTIQPAQDALIRFGATELGGGLEITNFTNELEDVIEGVKLNLISTSEKPITITISGDTERAIETVLTFANQFNEVGALINELTKFDVENGQIGPLLGDRDLTQIRDDLSRRIMDPVPGLPQSLNMLFALGLQLGDEGLLEIDEDKLRAQIEDDFGGVADVFRAKGESDNAGITFVNMTEQTKANPDGYEVDITQSARRGSYLSLPLQVPIVINESNNKLSIAVDGTQSQLITLEPGSYNLRDFARELQNQITNDEIIGNRRVRVVDENGRLRIFSARFGSRSSIEIADSAPGQSLPPGIAGGQAEAGVDVEGTINGEIAEGIGQLLKGPEDSDEINGLRLLVDVPENLIVPDGPEGKIVITKGIGSRLAKHVSDVLDPQTGNMQRITGNLRIALENIDDQLDQMNQRIERKRTRLQQRFARLEGQMSSLRSQQSFLSGQIGNLPGGGGGTPGLPGL